MAALRAAFILISIAGIMVSLAIFRAYAVLKRHPELTEKTGARLEKAKHRKDVTFFWGSRTKLRSFFIKDLTKCVYFYKANGRTYRLKTTMYYCTRKQVPQFIPIIYIKDFPKFCYINEPDSAWEIKYIISASVILAGSIILLGGILI